MFKEVTYKTNELSQIISKDKHLNLVTKQFMKRVQGYIHECFQKVKIIDKPNKDLEYLYNKRTFLRSKTDNKSKKDLEDVDEELCDKYSEVMYKKIMEEVLEGIEDCEDGGFNTGKLWRLKKKLLPALGEPPTAMLNSEGKLLTLEKDIKEEAVKHSQKVFKNKNINKGLEHLKDEQELLCKKRLKKVSRSKTSPWTVEDVTNVLKSLKNGKSKDPYDIPNELFKPSVAGDNLILAITLLMNRIKDELIFPNPMNLCNVTNLYKNKGSQQVFDSYRGIFRTPVLRNILDKLIYEDKYEDIDSTLTDCNVGSRKRRNVRDNLFVLNAITNASKLNPKEALDIVVYNVIKCFDSLWMSECINMLYEAGLQNDKLVLLHKSNEHANIVVKTSSGTTDRFPISNNVMQGTVWGGLMCTSTLDGLQKLLLQEEQLLYNYCGAVSVPPLEMVDDVITVVEYGNKSITVNAVVNAFIESKKLVLSAAKC